MPLSSIITAGFSKSKMMPVKALLALMIVIYPIWENGLGIEHQLLKLLLSYAAIIVLAALITMAGKKTIATIFKVAI